MSSGRAYVPPHRRRATAANTDESKDGPSTTKPFASARPQAALHGRQRFVADRDVEELCRAFTFVFCINLRRRYDRWEKFRHHLEARLGRRGQLFMDKVQRFDAVDGTTVMQIPETERGDDPDFPKLDWDATQNALYDRHIQPPMEKRMTPGEVGCAMSHARLWRKLWEDADGPNTTMLILEDDAIFYMKNAPKGEKSGRVTFLNVFTALGDILPEDWDVLYLGFSPRGEKVQVATTISGLVSLMCFRPTYGFHTHAYALTKHAASVLLENGPVCGPLDVWLAGNEWFGLKVYCAMVANEGYNGEGRSLVGQQRVDMDSDILMSGRAEERERRRT